MVSYIQSLEFLFPREGKDNTRLADKINGISYMDLGKLELDFENLSFSDGSKYFR